MKKLICVIEARMGSNRLPGKSMKILFKGERLIDFVIKNSLKSKFITKRNLFILTSKNKNNNKLVKHISKKYKLKIIRGSEKNVFSRYLKLSSKVNKLCNIVRLTADNPLVDPDFINKSISFILIKILTIYPHDLWKNQKMEE